MTILLPNGARLALVLCAVPFVFTSAQQSRAIQTESGSSAADVHWSGEFGRPGIDGVVHVLALFKGDLVAGGDFSRAGDTPAANIARWDGVEWHAFGDGIEGEVFSLAVHDGMLVAGSWFVAAWDGTSWSRIGEGVEGPVYALATYNGQLVAACTSIVGPGGVTAARGVARWDGTAWTPLGAGVAGVVEALAVHDGSLIAAGSFVIPGYADAVNIARWDGTEWTPLGSEFQSETRVLLSAGNDLYAAVTGSPSVDGPVYSPLVHRWDGTEWHPLGSASAWNGWGEVNAIAIHGGTVVAAGYCGSSRKIARWNGTSWEPIFTSADPIYALCEREGRLFAAGEIHLGESSRYEGIVQWTGDLWDHVGGPRGAGIAGHVKAFASYEGSVVAAGDLLFAGDAPVRTIARWDGSEWQAFPCDFNGIVNALELFGGELIAAGTLHAEPGCPRVNRIARWNGARWDSLGPGLASGVPLAMTVFRGELIVGGDEMDIARWDGVRWRTLGAGIGSPASPSDRYWVSAFAIFNGDLIAAGRFRTAGVHPAYTVARWDGESWHALGMQLRSTDYYGVRSLAVHGGDLYAVGDFYPDDGEPHTMVARWDGTNWSVVPGRTDVRVLTTYGPYLIAGCCVSCGARGVRRWDGSSWELLGSGLSGSSYLGTARYGLVDALHVHGSSLFVGGSFTGAGGKASYAVARWEEDMVTPPLFTPAQPSPSSQNVAFEIYLPESGDVTLAIYDIQGRRIARLLEGPHGAGPYSVSWDGRTESGEPVSSGIYFARFEAAGTVCNSKIVRAR
ncbi:MAG: FlgD immunoglobulin-like domain containing protein [Candidatus Eisenbacteria bacterium]